MMKPRSFSGGRLSFHSKQLRRFGNNFSNNSFDYFDLIGEENKSSGYNPYAKPPNLDLARKHGLSRKVGTISTLKENQELCPCCGYPTKYDDISTCCQNFELSFLGVGFPLYFAFLLYCFILLFSYSLIVGGFEIYMNTNGKTCEYYKNLADTNKNQQSLSCQPGFIITLSLANYQNEKDNLYVDILHILNFSFTIAAVFMMIGFRKWSVRLLNLCHKEDISCSDYTIEVRNLPEYVTETEIKEYFEKYGLGRGKEGTTVVKIIKCYKIASLLDLQVKKKKIATKKKEKFIHPTQEYHSNELENIDREIDRVISEFEIQNKDFSGVAYVVFKFEKDAGNVVQRWYLSYLERLFITLRNLCGKKGYQDFMLHGNLLYVHRAPEPTDIKWENIGLSKLFKAKSRFLTIIASMACLILFFGILIGIKYGQASLVKTEPDQVTVRIISFVIALLIVSVNGTLRFVIQKLAIYEKYSSWTYYYLHSAWKLGIAEFLNTAILAILINYIQNSEQFWMLWRSDSLVNDIFFLYLSNAYVTPLFQYIDIPYWYLLWKRNRLIKKPENYQKMMQKEANKLFEGPPLDMSEKYSIALRILYFSLFYANLIPIGPAISATGLIIIYWVDKYLLIKRYARPNELGPSLGEIMTTFLEYSLLIFTAGNIYFEKIMKNQNYSDTSVFNWISFFIALGYALIPTRYLLKWTSQSKNRPEEANLDYEKASLYFETDYERANPVTKERANQLWIQRMAEQEQNIPSEPNPATIHVQVVPNKDSTTPQKENPGNISAQPPQLQLPKENDFFSISTKKNQMETNSNQENNISEAANKTLQPKHTFDLSPIQQIEVKIHSKNTMVAQPVEDLLS